VIECGSLEYAQARLQSRHGQRAGEAVWQRLETAREFAALLDAVAQSPLRPWVAGLTAASPAHRIESVLRAHWRARVAELAGWMPPPWRPALEWCAVLPDLPLLQHLARGGAGPAWLADDPELGPLSRAAAGERAAALAAGPLAPLAGAWSAPDTLGQAWTAEWQRRQPRAAAAGGSSLAAVTQTLRTHVAAFGSAAPGTGWLLRRALQARLVLLMRRAALEPAAAFIDLALCALDGERLRGELLGRVLFPRPLAP
jgi:hypothetical protein